MAKALINKGITLGGLNHGEDAIAVYEDVLTRFGGTSEPVLREQVAMALINKGGILGTLNRRDDEVATYDDLLARFSSRGWPGRSGLPRGRANATDRVPSLTVANELAPPIRVPASQARRNPRPSPAPTCGRARFGAGPVDCRNVRVDGNMCFEFSAGSPRNVLNSSSAASAAMSEMGCRIVVSAGHTWLASGESSNPTTETSSGTPSPML